MSGPASHPTGGVSSCVGADVDPSAIADCLSRVLARLRWGSDGAAEVTGVSEITARTTRLVLPSLTTLAVLRPHVGEWDGIVHRRCRLVPVERSGGQADGAERLPGGAGLAWSTAARGWRTLNVSLMDGGTEVTHWLARHADGAVVHPAAASPSAPPEFETGEVSAMKVLAPEDSRVPDPGAVVHPAAASPSAPSPGGAQELLLTPADLACWAGATGDRNALHLVPGAAEGAGLEVGEGDVVAHGTLLAALSLAVAPAQRVDLRFLAPAVVPPGGVQLRLEPSGDVLSGGIVLLRRR